MGGATPVRRGGRPAPGQKAITTAPEQDEARKAQLLAQAEWQDRLTRLMASQDFRVFARWLVTQSQMFGIPVGWPHDAMREWTGRAAFGKAIWDELTTIDPQFAAEYLTPNR